jgi:hypothetical protein
MRERGGRLNLHCLVSLGNSETKQGVAFSKLELQEVRVRARFV